MNTLTMLLMANACGGDPWVFGQDEKPKTVQVSAWSFGGVENTDGRSDEGYKACIWNVREGRDSLLTVGNVEPPHVYTWKYQCRSIEGVKDGSYWCFKNDKGVICWEPYKDQAGLPLEVAAPSPFPVQVYQGTLTDCPGGV